MWISLFPKTLWCTNLVISFKVISSQWNYWPKGCDSLKTFALVTGRVQLVLPSRWPDLFSPSLFYLAWSEDKKQYLSILICTFWSREAEWMLVWVSWTVCICFLPHLHFHHSVQTLRWGHFPRLQNALHACSLLFNFMCWILLVILQFVIKPIDFYYCRNTWVLCCISFWFLYDIVFDTKLFNPLKVVLVHSTR